MDTDPSLGDTLAALRSELARLADRVAAIEARLSAPATPSKIAAPALDEELVAVISASIAAYLGCKPHIRQIRLVGNTSWAQYGRVTIQASHNVSAFLG
jgi:hypothetical protein